MKLIITLFAGLLLMTYATLFADGDLPPHATDSGDELPDFIANATDFDDEVGSVDSEDDDEESFEMLSHQEDTLVGEVADFWLFHFARDDWGNLFFEEGTDAEVIIGWTREHMASLGGIALAAGQDAFAQAYNTILPLGGNMELGVRAAQLCLERIRDQLLNTEAPLLEWVTVALVIVEQRRPFILGRGC